MSEFRNFEGCLTIIRSIKGDEIIAQALISEIERSNHTIIVQENNFDLSSHTHVLVHIYYNSEILEYSGTVRKMLQAPNRPISIFKCRKVTQTGVKRYALVNTGTVVELINKDTGVSERLILPLKVNLLNISSRGALISTTSSALKVDSCFKLKLLIEGEDVFINTTAVRENNKSDNSTELGCEFNYIYK